MTKNFIRCKADVKAEGDRFFMVGNTGVPMWVGGYKVPVIIDMAGAYFAKDTTPILAGHWTSNRLGKTVRQEILKTGESGVLKEKNVDGPAVICEWEFTNTNDGTESIREDLVNGFPFEASIGADPEVLEMVEKGTNTTVNGVEYEGPLAVARKARISEISVVVFGADRYTSTFKAQYNFMGENDMKKEEKINAENCVDKTLNGAESSQEVQAPAFSAEDARQLGIQTAAAAFQAGAPEHSGEIEMPGGMYFKTVEAAEKYALGNSSVSIQAFKKALLEAARNRPVGPKGPAVHMVDNEITSEVMECAILRNVQAEAGIPNRREHTADGKEEYGFEAWFSEKVLEKADSPKVRNPTLSQMYATLIHQVTGLHAMPRAGEDSFWAEAASAWASAKGRINAAGASPLQVDHIWQNVANKVLLSSFEKTPVTCFQWAKIVNVKDFKPTSMITMDLDGTLKRVGNNGVIQDGRMSDSSIEVSTDEFARKYGITRKERINDDMNSILSKLITIGRVTPSSIEQLAYYTLLSGLDTYFTAALGNRLTGAEYAFGIDTIDKVVQTYDDKVGFDGQPISVTPDRVIVGTALKKLANELFLKDHPTVAYKTGKDNEIRYTAMDNTLNVGKLRPICSAYLNNTAIRHTIETNSVKGEPFPNQSATQYFILPDPALTQGAAFYIPCLHGNIRPHVESFEFDPSMLGTGIRVYADFNVCAGKTELMTYVAGK